MLISLVSLKLQNVKKFEKLIKIVNIDGQNFHIIWTIWGFSMKFSGKMWIMIILTATKKQSFALYLEDTVFEKPLEVGVKLTSSKLFRVNQYCQYLNLPTFNQSSMSNQLFNYLVTSIFKFICWLHWFIGLFGFIQL